MKFADLAPNVGEASQIDADALVRPANEDSPSGAALYELISRRPSALIPVLATLAAMLLFSAEAAYFSGMYSERTLASLSPHEWGFLAVAFAVPLLLIGSVAWLAWRAQEMRLMADALAQTAIRLSDPQDFTADQVASLTQRITSEITRVQQGFEAALEQATKLSTLVSSELEEIEKSSARAETRTHDMQEAFTRHKSGLEEIAQTLSRESDNAARVIRESVETVRGVTGEAELSLLKASTGILEQTEGLARVSEAARIGADATTSMLDHQSSRLEVVASSALANADSISQRYDAQRLMITEAADRLESEHKRLDTVFIMHREEMLKANIALAERTNDITNAAAELAIRLNATFESASLRTADLRESIRTDVAQVTSEIEQVHTAMSRTAGAATRAIGATVEELKSATTILNEDVARLAETLTEEVGTRIEDMRVLVIAASQDNDAAAERFNAAMIRLGGAAKEAGRYMREATDDVAARIAELPDEAAESATSLKTILEEHITALAAISEIVVNNSRTLDRSARLTVPDPKILPPPPPPSLPTRSASALPTGQRIDTNRRWGIPELLAAAGRSPDESRYNARPDPERDFQRGALHVIETLQALAVDLDHALESSPPPELWRRYQAGERNIFARRLYSMAGRELYDRIASRHRSDGEFRDQVDQFTTMFERLLAEASGRDRDNILVETYLTSDTGKVYLMLAQATGKLS